MRFFVVAIFVVLSFATSAFAQPDVSGAVKEWAAAVASRSPEKVVALYGKDAVMFSAFAMQPMTTREALIAYYKKALDNPDITVDIGEEHPRTFGNVAVNSGLYTFHYTQDGEPVDVPSRFTFIYELRGGKWVIIEHHSSQVPHAE